MTSVGELKQVHEQAILGILRGERPLDFTRAGAEDLLVGAISAQPEFRRDINGRVISADILEQKVKERIRDFRARCATDSTSLVCNSVMRIETKEDRWNVRLYNYDEKKEMKLLPAGQARLGIERTPPLEDKIDEVRRNMGASILASPDPAPWL